MNATADRAIDHALAARLPVAWPAFFAKFGRLTPVQRLAIPLILEGMDVVVAAPTASGKTEAVCAPLVERWHRHPDWMILYISPTRALVNDLFERLSGPTTTLGYHLARRTGDHNQRPPGGTNLLLTTPESFDSLLCRARTPDGHLLQRVCAVVLDEVHLLHGSARGEQLRWLLERLRRIREVRQQQKPQVVALSATVDDPEGIRKAFAPDGVFAPAAGARTIERVAVPDVDITVEAQLPAYLRTLEQPEKLLVFSNSRKRVDSLAHRFKEALVPLKYEVRAHHGSLSRKIREEAEDTARRERRLVLFSSSTLEVGVDIGDIDLVVLDGPAPDIMSLLQRIGRGNRRTGRTRVLACAQSVTESLVQAAMLSAAEQGYLGVRERGPQLAVARQQIASYIFQRANGQRTAERLHSFCQTLLPSVDAPALTSHLMSAGELLETSTALRLGDFWQEQAETGSIHSNIESNPGQRVSDEKSGDEIATAVRFREGPGLKIAGRMLQVRDWDAFRVVVREVAGKNLSEAKWSYVTASRLKGAGQADAVRQFLGIPPGQWPIVEAHGHHVVFHFGGGRRRAVLELIETLNPGRLGEIDEWALYFTARPVKPTPGLIPDVRKVMQAAERNILRLERTLARPRANTLLPQSMRTEEVLGWLNVAAEVSAFSSSTWTSPVDHDVTRVLESLVTDLLR